MLERYAVFEKIGNDRAPVLIERFENEMQAARMATNQIAYFAIDLEDGIGVHPPAERRI